MVSVLFHHYFFNLFAGDLDVEAGGGVLNAYALEVVVFGGSVLVGCLDVFNTADVDVGEFADAGGRVGDYVLVFLFHAGGGILRIGFLHVVEVGGIVGGAADGA